MPSSGVRMSIPAARHKMFVFGATLTLAMWPGIFLILLQDDARIDFPVMILRLVFPASIVLSWLLNAWIALNLWFYSTRLDAKKGTLEFASGLFGGRSHAISSQDIESIVEDVSLQNGQSIYYSIKLTTVKGKKYLLATQIRRKLTAKKIVSILNGALAGKKIDR
jgi:hypothetical protein